MRPEVAYKVITMSKSPQTGPRMAGTFALLAAALTVASCSGSESPISGVPTPSAVPARAAAVVGDTEISNDDFRDALKVALTGFDPLSPTRATPEPLDPPEFGKCVSAIEQRAQDDPDLKGLSRATFLESCRQRYGQLRSLTLSRLIEQRWALVEADLEGLEVSGPEADAFIDQVRLSWAADPVRSRARFEKALAASGISPSELSARAEAAVAQQKLASLRASEGESPEAATENQRERFDLWRSKTLCAEELIVPQCSNSPQPGA